MIGKMLLTVCLAASSSVLIVKIQHVFRNL